MAAGGCQGSEGQAEVRATWRTGVLRIGDHQVTRTPSVETAQIVQRALRALLALGLVPTTRTGVLFGVATAGNNRWRWSLLRACDAFRGIGPVYAGSSHI